VFTVRWDIGLQGLGVLAAYSLGFGLIAQLVLLRSATPWLWLIAAGTFFVAGLVISEVWFGSATGAELQPNIDGLSRDEALLAFIPASVAVWIVWALGRRHMRHRRGDATWRILAHPRREREQGAGRHAAGVDLSWKW
jgi:hypothetical protein